MEDKNEIQKQNRLLGKYNQEKIRDTVKENWTLKHDKNGKKKAHWDNEEKVA